VALNAPAKRSGWRDAGAFSIYPKERSPMEQYNEELKAHLMATDEHFREIAEEHLRFHKMLEEIESKPHLTTADEEEENRLKKQKLRLKDEMISIMSRYRAQQVA
jgi:uncharacterized protein YdcH (DUF465 family)